MVNRMQSCGCFAGREAALDQRVPPRTVTVRHVPQCPTASAYQDHLPASQERCGHRCRTRQRLHSPLLCPGFSPRLPASALGGNMLVTLLLALLLSPAAATTKDRDLPRLNDTSAAEAFVDSGEVVVIGFLEGEESQGYKELVAAAKRVPSVPVAICSEKEVWADYSLSAGTITLFRKADGHRENLVVEDVRKLDADGLVNFISINELRYITEYNQVTAVGLFHSQVKSHLLLFANGGSKDYAELKKQLGALAPEFTGKFLFVLINGALKSNSQSLGYFGLKSKDLPRVGIYDGDGDKKWLLPDGDISARRVRDFCQSFLRGELEDVEQAGAKTKTEL
ncbi:endoplasmic reticulum resident protein 27 [Betta splendens]|uniref:Endoplasmic reticulum resident protein 27 n=1 Tax=Betta splendens TaxID=158456 RepID=A0A6P7M7K1_BETSP|nr:endoplasmic reticulum resident protein 27 [Betta splendens]